VDASGDGEGPDLAATVVRVTAGAAGRSGAALAGSVVGAAAAILGRG
jgi:hypothetical protein